MWHVLPVHVRHDQSNVRPRLSGLEMGFLKTSLDGGVEAPIFICIDSTKTMFGLRYEACGILTAAYCTVDAGIRSKIPRSAGYILT